MGDEVDQTCPGCGLRLPRRPSLDAHGYYNASPECWSIYTEVLGAEFSNAVIFGQVHQLTVDAYAVQHAGGPHPDKSVDIHLAGLHLMLVRGVRPPYVPPLLQQIAKVTREWPHFAPPQVDWPMTAFDVALSAGEFDAHISAVRAWSAAVWRAWSIHHDAVAAFVEERLGALAGADVELSKGGVG